MNPLAIWKSRGGHVIELPEEALKIPREFSDEFNLQASTIVQLALSTHLDSLNGRR